MFGIKKHPLVNCEHKKVIVLIGGSGYLGSELIKNLKRNDNLQIIVVSKNGLVSGGGVISIRHDITKNEEGLINKILNITGKIDVLVHMAAVYSFETSDKMSLCGMMGDFRTNTVAPVLVTQACNNLFWKEEGKEENLSKKRKVIIIGSKAGDGVSEREELITYSGTKAALEVMFDYYQKYLKPFGIETVFLKPGSLKEKEVLEGFVGEIVQAL